MHVGTPCVVHLLYARTLRPLEHGTYQDLSSPLRLISAHRIEACLLLVAEKTVESCERGLDGLHRCECAREPLLHGFGPSHRREHLVARALSLERGGRLCRSLPQLFEHCALGFARLYRLRNAIYRQVSHARRLGLA